MIPVAPAAAENGPESPPAPGPSDASREDLGESAGLYAAADFRAAYASGETTPTAVVAALLKAVAADERHRVAFLSIRDEDCRAAAAESTERYRSGKTLGPLDGVPVAVKDEVDVEGHARCYGSKCVATPKATATSWCVRQWEQAGAVVVGKTSMHEFGLGPSCPFS